MSVIVTNSPRPYQHRRYIIPGGNHANPNIQPIPPLAHPSISHQVDLEPILSDANMSVSNISSMDPIPPVLLETHELPPLDTPTSTKPSTNNIDPTIKPRKSPSKSTPAMITSSMILNNNTHSPLLTAYSQHMNKTTKLTPKITSH